MNSALDGISERILNLAIAALAQANTHAVFSDPGNEHWEYMSILNAAHAAELFLKAIIAKEHPLLIFKDIFDLDDRQSATLDIKTLTKRGRTHDFSKLPQVLWVTTGKRIPNEKIYKEIQDVRNSIQHFCVPERDNLRRLSLECIYYIIDPLIRDEFNIYAIEFHEDHSIGYDYIVQKLIHSEIKFSVPPYFNVEEINIDDEIENTSNEYKEWIGNEIYKIKCNIVL